jgi:hypothetical protein
LQEWNCNQQRLVCLGPWQWHKKMSCVCTKMIFLRLPHQGAIPQILKLEFPMKTWGPKQTCKWNKMKIMNFFKISLLHAGTKHFHCICRKTLIYLQHNVLYFIFSSLVHKIQTFIF